MVGRVKALEGGVRVVRGVVGFEGGALECVGAIGGVVLGVGVVLEVGGGFCKVD